MLTVPASCVTGRWWSHGRSPSRLLIREVSNHRIDPCCHLPPPLRVPHHLPLALDELPGDEDRADRRERYLPVKEGRGDDALRGRAVVERLARYATRAPIALLSEDQPTRAPG